MDTETNTGSDTMTTPDLSVVAGEPAHRLESDQAAELLLEMAALTRIALGAHRAAGSTAVQPEPAAQPAPSPAEPATIAVPALEVPALDVPPLATPPQVNDRDRMAVLQEIAFLDE